MLVQHIKFKRDRWSQFCLVAELHLLSEISSCYPSPEFYRQTMKWETDDTIWWTWTRERLRAFLMQRSRLTGANGSRHFWPLALQQRFREKCCHQMSQFQHDLGAILLKAFRFEFDDALCGNHPGRISARIWKCNIYIIKYHDMGYNQYIVIYVSTVFTPSVCLTLKWNGWRQSTKS